MSRNILEKKHLEFSVGKSINFDQVVILLHTFGYIRIEKLTDFGQFSVDGGVIKVYSPFSLDPIAIDFFGNQIDKIYKFKILSNKKIYELSSVIIESNITEVDGGKIKNGDLIVHINQGIGIYRGKILKKVGLELKKFIAIEYANNDRLFLPESQIEKITRYLGISRRQPRLSRLGSVVWEKSKKKIEQSIYQLAKELLEVYAKREISRREKYKIDYEWDDKLKKSFAHQETPDQEKSLSEIYQDLEKGIPMDRLLIGDVGFGKTEVAVRAAAQVISNDKQVAILAPTTILSRQHFATITERLKDFPVKVAELSRFVKKNAQNEIVKNISSGSVDLIIGTHRLLGADIKFKNLGLLIIDEEQRFGVKDKEKLKKYKNDVDVLSLSATPIPRTLFISLSGIRQISVIKTAPKNRRPIKTTVEKYQKEKVLQYLKFEIKRFGKVYFLHNDVKTIEARAVEFRKLLPKNIIAVAHGQMPEEKLSAVMADFAAGKIDVLICSTIIENGLDVELANTLIVEECDRFGLSQLYQIRGRIGRGKNQARAYFTYRKNLVGNAYKRLTALAEKTELGSGFDIAFSDLEIRGGGNILGRQQHGNMEELGLILYTKLLNQAVKKLKQSRAGSQ
ncbi:MAG: helicase-related protein [Candidatus Berkelbacteria bacterium]|nr:helicase-related protein [Candidatus Berkelbacteria bacterium]